MFVSSGVLRHSMVSSCLVLAACGGGQKAAFAPTTVASSGGYSNAAPSAYGGASPSYGGGYEPAPAHAAASPSRQAQPQIRRAPGRNAAPSPG